MKRNVHAHVVFYNYDFEKSVSPWRSLKKKDFSNFQNIAAKAFERAGFERGVSREHTSKKHLEKNDFVEQKIHRKQQSIDELEIEIDLLNTTKRRLIDDNSSLKMKNKILSSKNKKLKALYYKQKRSIEALLSQFKNKITTMVDILLKREYETIYNRVDDVQAVIDETYEGFDKMFGDEMTIEGNKVAQQYFGDKLFKKKVGPKL